MARVAAYDEIADWYEEQFLGAERGDVVPNGDVIGIYRSLRHLVGDGSGTCLDLGCGTGAHAVLLRELGWDVVGIDPSAGMLRHARDRLPVALAEGAVLPFGDGLFPRAIAAMVHTDISDYAAVLREVARVLRPGGVFVHVGVHPCFCGGFADRSVGDALVIHPGYLDSYWTKASWTDRGVRDKVGAMHRPLPELLSGFLAAGLVLEGFAEGGAPTPVTLAIKARKPG